MKAYSDNCHLVTNKHLKTILMNSFFTSQFSNGSLVWTYHSSSRIINNKISNLHEV